jgi:superfamily I DNA/RNA helicase
MGLRNRSTTRVASTLIDAMWRQVRSERGRERTKEEFSEEIRTDDTFLEFAAAWWPVLDAATVLGWLRDPDLLARVSDGVLDDESVRLLNKSWSADGSSMSVDDVAMLDELRYLLGDPPIVNTGSVDDEYLAAEDASLHEVFTASDREYAGPGGWTPPTNRIEDDAFAHVLVDEAQDLSPMQWRMVGRRGRGATWTIVGDLAQSSWPVPAESASARAKALGDKPRHDFHLSTNYRNSAEIYDFAAEYAGRAGLDADLPDAVRSTGVEPAELRVDDLESAVHEHLSELAAALQGSIGIVVPTARLGEVTRWVSSWPEHANETGGPDSRIVVLTGLDTKGLEFDGIIVVQPQEIEDESHMGKATLYVVYTRATQRMVILTSQEAS